MKIMVINGPNLDFLGIREPGVYGPQTYSDLEKKIETHAEDMGCLLYTSDAADDV